MGNSNNKSRNSKEDFKRRVIVIGLVAVLAGIPLYLDEETNRIENEKKMLSGSHNERVIDLSNDMELDNLSMEDGYCYLKILIDLGGIGTEIVKTMCSLNKGTIPKGVEWGAFTKLLKESYITIKMYRIEDKNSVLFTSFEGVDIWYGCSCSRNTNGKLEVHVFAAMGKPSESMTLLEFNKDAIIGSKQEDNLK